MKGNQSDSRKHMQRMIKATFNKFADILVVDGGDVSLSWSLFNYKWQQFERDVAYTDVIEAMYAYYSQINPSHKDPNPILLSKEFSVVFIGQASTPIKNTLSGVVEAKRNRYGVALNNEHNIKLLRAQYIEHVVDRDANSDPVVKSSALNRWRKKAKRVKQTSLREQGLVPPPRACAAGSPGQRTPKSLSKSPSLSQSAGSLSRSSSKQSQGIIRDG